MVVIARKRHINGPIFGLFVCLLEAEDGGLIDIQRFEVETAVFIYQVFSRLIDEVEIARFAVCMPGSLEFPVLTRTGRLEFLSRNRIVIARSSQCQTGIALGIGLKLQLIIIDIADV